MFLFGAIERIVVEMHEMYTVRVVFSFLALLDTAVHPSTVLSVTRHV